MKGDFTRFTHKPVKHYSGVLKQQGRVGVDADWNEYVSIQDHLTRTRITDVIGYCGVPKHDGGFEISNVTSASGSVNFSISSGRIYVDGIVCSLEPDGTTYHNQLDYPEPLAVSAPVNGRTDLIYLDVWHRHITAIEDPDIREVALGGPDTATRIKTVWQVKVSEDVGPVECEDTIAGWPPPQSGGLLSNEVQTPPTEDPCYPTPSGGYRGLENQLYRVEIHDGSDPGPATFKWSRDNGSVVFPIDEFVAGEPTKIKLKHLGRDQIRTLQEGDWVEVLGDEKELKQEPGTLASVEDINEAEHILTLSVAVSAHSQEGHPKVRRWDQKSNAISVASQPAHPLEDGIQIQFSGSNFKTGDYWAFAARTATGGIEELNNAEPLGIKHHYCRLALLTWHVDAGGNVTANVQDCRKDFPPLTELPSFGGCCTVTVGDGVKSTGQYTDIQAAINTLENGGRVCILPGEYILQDTVQIPYDNVIISGCGQQTRIIGPQEIPAFRIEDRNQVGFESLYVETNSDQGGIQVRSSHNFKLTGCWIINNGDGPCLSVQSQTLRIAENHLMGGGIWINDGSANVLIQGNKISDGYGSGIGLGGPLSFPPGYPTGIFMVEIVDNHIDRMDSNGISMIRVGDYVPYVMDVTIAQNRIMSCVRVGPDTSDTISFMLPGMQIAGGIVLTNVFQIKIHNNEISNNGSENQIPACGIFTYGCQGVEVTDNRVVNNGTNLPQSRCVDFTMVESGDGVNPRIEQGVTFTVLDSNGTTNVTDFQNFRGLNCYKQTEIALPFPCTWVKLSLISSTSPATVDIEAFNQDGSSAGTQQMSVIEEPEVFSFTGTAINRILIKTEDDLTLLVKLCIGRGTLQTDDIDFSSMPVSQSPQNPRLESGVYFQVFEGQGNLASNTEIRTTQGYTGLYCNFRTNVFLPFPVKSVELMFVNYSGGIGYAPPPTTIVAYNSDGSIAGQAQFSAEAQPKTYTFMGDAINYVNIETSNNEFLLLKFCFDRTELCCQAGIAALYVTGGFFPSPSAARIHDNMVLCPKGKALLTVGWGSISVAYNNLTSLSIWEGLDCFNQLLFPGYIGAQQPIYGMQFYQGGPHGQCVLIMNFGSTPMTWYLMGVPGLMAGVNLEYGGLTNNLYSLQPTGGFYQAFYQPDGRTMFHGNQVNLKEYDTTDFYYIPSSVYITSYDDVSFQNNQIQTETYYSFIIQNVFVFASTIRAVANRFTELFYSTGYSYYSYGASMNSTTNNQATHCIYSGCSTPDKVIEDNNIILLSENCQYLYSPGYIVVWPEYYFTSDIGV